MNRAERRRQGKNKDAVYNMKRSDIQRIKDQSTESAARIAFKLLLGIPVMVFHDKFGQLIKKEVGDEESWHPYIVLENKQVTNLHILLW